MAQPRLMKLISFEVGGARSFGIATPKGVVDAAKRLGLPDLRTALAGGAHARLRDLAGEAPDYALDAVNLLPVIPNPDKIICVGVNYASHLKETGREPPAHPMLFPRFASSQVGHGQALIRPPESEHYDFEGELAVVIGKAGRRIPRARAFDHVAGYSCYNDGTIRDYQRHTTQFMPGKCFDRSGAFGPWLVTADGIADPSRLTLETRLNGEVMQQAPVSDLIFDVPALIAYISLFTTLSAGDVIVTGTTGGVGAFRTPPVWMRDGDLIEVEISGIGVLANRVKDEQTTSAAG